MTRAPGDTRGARFRGQALMEWAEIAATAALWSCLLARLVRPYKGRTVVALLALLGTTAAALAGPYIAIIRAFNAVKGGDLKRPLRFRSSDVHLREVEVAFDSM